MGTGPIAMHVDLTGPAGRLEGLLESPGSPRFAALVLHPHPLLGGTLHNHATYQIARAARLAGGASLRIQFRGVGLSQGKHTGGPGEVADARAALLWNLQECPVDVTLRCGRARRTTRLAALDIELVEDVAV